MLTIFLDRAFSEISDTLGLQRISLLTYLFIAFGFNLVLTLISAIFKLKGKGGYVFNNKEGIKRISALMIVLSITLLLVGIITSSWTFRYSFILIIAMLSIPITAYIMLINDEGPPRPVHKNLLLVFTVIIPFAFTAKLIANGIDEGEVTSDMINIYLNGYFRWSIHGNHYDLAPLDAILKVMLTYVTNSSIYDPVLGMIMYSSYGLASLLIAYTLAERILRKPIWAMAIVLLVMTSYPYSPLVGLGQYSTIFSQLLAFLALFMVVRSLLGYNSFGLGSYITTLLLILTSILLHPSALTIPLYLALILTLLAYRRGLERHQYLLHLILFASIVYILKALYTAFATGFIGYFNTLVEFVMRAFSEEAVILTTRNPGYSALPRLCLTGFALLPGFIGGLAITSLHRLLKGYKRHIDLVEALFMITVMFYATMSLASLLTGLGGISQSRVLFNGAQPFMELVLIVYLSNLFYRTKRPLLLIPLLIASMFSLLTPNAMPLNYTIPTAMKGATVNDHVISYAVMGLVDAEFHVRLYESCGGLGRIVNVQERGDVGYGIGATMSIVRYLIAPRVVAAKSYWDPCIIAIHSMPKNIENYVVQKIFDAWVYGLHLFMRK